MNNITTLKKGDFNIIEERFLEVSNKDTFTKEVTFAIGIFKGNNYLNKATKESKLDSVMNLAMTGLTLNPVLKLAYLIPYFSDGAVKCRVEPSYQGLVKLITDTGSAKTVYSHIVYDGDDFEVSLGTSVEIIHKPQFKSTDILKVYAVAILNDGTKQIEVMTTEQVDEIRDNSESFKAFKNGKTKSCIWNDHFGEMAKKTVIKRLVKYLPKTDIFEKLGTAIDLDNQDFGATHNQIDYIDSLLMTAAISPQQLEDFDREKSYMTQERAGEVIQYLKDNQLDPVLAGNNYSQTDINTHLNKET